jgi:hypothetical protein
MSFTTLVLHATICPDRQYNLINIVRRIATCMEESKTDYMYQAMFNDRNLTLFWRYDIRLIGSSITLPSMGVAKKIFLNFFYLPSFPTSFMFSRLSYLPPFLTFPSLTCVFPFPANIYFCNSVFISCYRSVFLCFSPVCLYFFCVRLNFCFIPSFQFQHFLKITVQP